MELTIILFCLALGNSITHVSKPSDENSRSCLRKNFRFFVLYKYQLPQHSF